MLYHPATHFRIQHFQFHSFTFTFTSASRGQHRSQSGETGERRAERRGGLQEPLRNITNTPDRNFILSIHSSTSSRRRTHLTPSARMKVEALMREYRDGL